MAGGANPNTDDYAHVGAFLDVESESDDLFPGSMRSPDRRHLAMARLAARMILLAGFVCVLGVACVVVSRSAQRVSLNEVGSLSSVRLDGVISVPSTGLLATGSFASNGLGGRCDLGEELFAGLCYKKCNVLTNGQAPIRTSSWTCCEGHPCTPFNQHGSFGKLALCSGFDVSASGACPHNPGDCRADEELFFGVCYKKCGLLTNGEFMHRIAAATCCKTGRLGCMDLFNDITNKAFDIGGGDGPDGVAHMPEAPPDADATPSPSQAPTVVMSAPVVVPGNLEPAEHRHDGNLCGDNEELYAGLCYKNCSLLTKGEAPIRTSSWTCCEKRPCGLLHEHGSAGRALLCNGFDIGGDGSCPHKPGACLVDEELDLGVCFKKCGLLTGGRFPFRFAAATCCKERGLGCLNFRNDLTSPTFDVGGGGGDGDAATPAEPHLPQQSLTETVQKLDHEKDSTKSGGGGGGGGGGSSSRSSSSSGNRRSTAAPAGVERAPTMCAGDSPALVSSNAACASSTTAGCSVGASVRNALGDDEVDVDKSSRGDAPPTATSAQVPLLKAQAASDGTDDSDSDSNDDSELSDCSEANEGGAH